MPRISMRTLVAFRPVMVTNRVAFPGCWVKRDDIRIAGTNLLIPEIAKPRLRLKADEK